MPDDALLDVWQQCRKEQTEGPGFDVRGWYHTLYSEWLSQKKILEVGSGLGFDGVTFAQKGARTTFVDLAPTNIEVIRRLCKILKIDGCNFLVLDSVETLTALPRDYEVVLAVGSLHHAPASVIRPEVQELLRHLKAGGRWLQLAYPRSRWEAEGCLSFERWGEKTDGLGTPWAEWYDVPKLVELFGPAHLECVLYREWHNNSFNWFDFIFRGMKNKRDK